MSRRSSWWLRGEQTGDERLDDKYVVLGADAGQARAVIHSTEVERAIDRLLEGRGFERLHVGSGSLTGVKKRDASALHAAERVADFRALCRLARLLDRHELPPPARAAGAAVEVRIERRFAWTDGGSAPLCPFCRDELDPAGGEAEPCPSCATLHHGECLREAGRCAVFGCAGSGRAGVRQRGA